MENLNEYSVSVGHLMTLPWFRRAVVQESKRQVGVLCANAGIAKGRKLTGRERLVVVKEYASGEAVVMGDAGMPVSRALVIRQLCNEYADAPDAYQRLSSRLAWVEDGLRERQAPKLSDEERTQWQ